VPAAVNLTDTDSGTSESPATCHCSAGTYLQPRVDSSNHWEQVHEGCYPCPRDEYSLGGDEQACLKCDQLGHSHYCAAGKRVTCPTTHGTTCDQGGIISAFGKFVNDDALQECTPGHYCDGDLLEKACEAGTYAGGTSTVACLPLKNGYYAADASGNHVTEAGVVSVVCPVGWHCSNGDKVSCDDDGDYCEEGSSTPAECAAGFFCPDTATKTECTSGSYCPARSTVESDCAGGHYCSTPASQVECEVGTFCEERSAVPEPCLSCAVGEGQIAPCTTETNTQCEACGANEVSTGGDSDCVACENSTISNAAKSACLPCPIGEYREGGMDICESIPCLAGTYCVTASTKKDCPKGMLILSYLSMCN
jgi:hypothetical protein